MPTESEKINIILAPHIGPKIKWRPTAVYLVPFYPTDLTVRRVVASLNPSSQLSQEPQSAITAAAAAASKYILNMRDASSAALAVLAAALCTGSSVAFLTGGGAFLGGQARHPTMSQNMCHSRPTTCMSFVDTDKAAADAARTLGAFLAGATLIFGSGGAALADGSTQKFSLPPVSQSKDRCMFKSSAMGQANAARDKLYDLRECDLRWDLGGGGDTAYECECICPGCSINSVSPDGLHC